MASRGRRLYENVDWRKLRLRVLARSPWCVVCRQDRKHVRAVIVDHIVPHRGDVVLFWDEANLQTLCKWHHDSWKSREERSGYKIAKIGEDGFPIGGEWEGGG